MVTANLSNVSSQFQSIVEERDVNTMVPIALAGAGGGILAVQLSDRVLPYVNISGRPDDAQSYAANSLFKLLVGAGLAYAATEIGGSVGTLLGIAGLGAIVVSGADAVSLLQSVSLSAEQRVSASANAITASSRSGAVSVREAGQQTRTPEDEIQFRQTAAQADGGPEPQTATAFR